MSNRAKKKRCLKLKRLAKLRERCARLKRSDLYSSILATAVNRMEQAFWDSDMSSDTGIPYWITNTK